MQPTEEGVRLEHLLEYVERAVRGDRALLVSLFRTLQRLANHPTAAPEDRRLGQVLSLVLMGDRQPDLSDLPPEIRAELEGWLAHLSHK